MSAPTDRDARWGTYTATRRAGQGGKKETVRLPGMNRNEVITLAARLRIDAMELLVSIAFLESIASGMTAGGTGTVGGLYSDAELEAIRGRFERRFRQQPRQEA